MTIKHLLAGLLAATALAASAQAEGSSGTPEESRRFEGAPRLGSSDSRSIKLRGRAQYDLGHVERPDGVTLPDLGYVDEFRRVRFGIEGTAPHGFSYVFEMDFAEEVEEIVDAYVAWKR